jgi:hypothetical protein
MMLAKKSQACLHTKRTMKSKVITRSEFEVDGDVYQIAVRDYDENLRHVTSDWCRQSDGQKGQLGYGVPSCDQAISLAESAILRRRKIERRAA